MRRHGFDSRWGHHDSDARGPPRAFFVPVAGTDDLRALLAAPDDPRAPLVASDARARPVAPLSPRIHSRAPN